MNGKYDDIIGLPHPVSLRHKPMSIADRAAQFSPFSALNGYEETIAETGRLTDPFAEADEETIQLLSSRLLLLQEHEREHPAVEMTVFVPDARKSGGSYQQISGFVRQIDACAQHIRLTDGRQIAFSAISELDSPLFAHQKSTHL